MENFVMKEKFTNLHMQTASGMRSQRCCTGGALRVAVDGNRENLYREIPFSKQFRNESSIQVE